MVVPLRDIPPELAVICFGCPHLKKKGGLRCEQNIGACHSKKVKEWRKANKLKEVANVKRD